MGKNTTKAVRKSDRTKVVAKKPQTQQKSTMKRETLKSEDTEQPSPMVKPNKTRKLEPKRLNLSKGKLKNNNVIPTKSPTKPNNTKKISDEMEQIDSGADLLEFSGNEFEMDGIRVTVNASEDDFEDEEYTDLSDCDPEMGDDQDEDSPDEEIILNDPTEGTDMPSTSTEGITPQGLMANPVESENSQIPQIESEEQAYHFLATNPHLRNVFKRMIKEGVAEETRKLVIPKQSKGKINNMQSQSSGLNKLNKNNPDKSEDNGKEKSFTFGKRGECECGEITI